MEHLSDTALLELILSGNTDALVQVHRRKTGYLYQLVRRILDPEQVEEAIREAFWILWIDPSRIKRGSGGKPTQEIFRLTLQTAHRLRFATRAIEVPLEYVQENLAVNTFEDRVIDGLDIDILFRVLTLEQRELLELHFYYGLTFRDISRYKGISLGRVHSKIMDAKALFLVHAKKLGYEV